MSQTPPQWSSQDIPGSVGTPLALCDDITDIDIHWLKGKSYWIFYAICRRLTQRLPTLWYRGGTLYLFASEGVYEMVHHFPCTQFLSRVWTLTDTDESSVVPPSIAGSETQCLVIFTSSPDRKRWKGLAKNTTCVEVIMNPWSRREISEALVIYFHAWCLS